jgi:hypothetical protein
LYFDGEVKADSEYLFDGKKMIRSTKPTDLLFGPPLYTNIRTYKRKASIRLTRRLYFDGSIGANGKFNFSGEIIGAKVGYSYVKVTKKVTVAKTGQAFFDGQWKANGEILFDGKFTYYQSGIETYFVKEV